MVPVAVDFKPAIFAFVFPAIPTSAPLSFLKHLFPEQAVTPQKSEFRLLKATFQASKF